MTDFPKASDLFRKFRDEVVSRADRLTLNAVDRDGSDANIIGYGAAIVGEEVIGQLASVEEGRWLDSSRGAKLDRLAWDRYGLIRKTAAPSFVTLAFSTIAAAAAAFSIPIGSKATTSDGHEFITIASATFPLSSTGPVFVLARSTLSGADQDVQKNTIRSITGQIIGSPTDLSVTNPSSSAGAAAAENDDKFKARIRKFWTSVRRGTKGAIEAGALAVPGVSVATAFEGLVGPAYPNRMVSLVVSDDFTDALVIAGVSDTTYDTRSQAFAAFVASSLDEYRACGISVNVSVAQTAMIAVAMRFHFQSTVSDPDTLALYARAQVVQRVNEIDPGEPFDPDIHVFPVLKSIPGLDVKGDEVESPAGTIDPISPYQVLRTTLALVTVSSQSGLSAFPPNYV